LNKRDTRPPKRERRVLAHAVHQAIIAALESFMRERRPVPAEQGPRVGLGEPAFQQRVPIVAAMLSDLLRKILAEKHEAYQGPRNEPYVSRTAARLRGSLIRAATIKSRLLSRTQPDEESLQVGDVVLNPRYYGQEKRLGAHSLRTLGLAPKKERVDPCFRYRHFK
jgi:hypothetical protein